MKIKYLLLLLSTLIFSCCVVGGLEEADNIDGTWISTKRHLLDSDYCYIYYNFDPTSIDSSDGDHSGKYSIKAYNSLAPWGSNYKLLEKGRYYTDYIFSTIEFRDEKSNKSRFLEYELDEDDFYLKESHYWSGTKLHLKKQ